MGEYFGKLSEERERELHPLYMHCLACSHGEKLLETHRKHLAREREQIPMLSRFFERACLGLQGWDERHGELNESERLLLQNMLGELDKGLLPHYSCALDDLTRKIKLACLLRSETIEGLYEAILPDYDEFGVINGAPDLFLWYPKPAYILWFFAEVKGHGDHLRESQSRWIRGYWEHIHGRVMILHVD